MNTSTIAERFLKVNKNLGLIIGVWPFQKSSLKKRRRFMVLSIMICCYITQFSRLIEYPSMNTVLTDYPYLIVGVGTIIKLGNYFINESKLNVLLKGIYDDWRVIESMDEYNIMIKYAKRGLFMALLYLSHVSIVIICFVILPFVPIALDMIVPLNESRKRLYSYPVYYFVDHEKYYFFIITHMNMTLTVLGVAYIACDSNYVYSVQHACGLLAVAGHRFKHACHCLTSHNEENVEKLMGEVYRRVSYSIQGHQRALRYVKEIEATHDTCMLISVGLLMVCISVSLLKIATLEHDVEWSVNCIFFVAQLLHMLFLTIQGQFVTNSFNDLYYTISEALWYNSNCEIQALYVLALRRNLIHPVLTAGGFVTLNLKTFAEIIKASVSYYTVIQST